MIQNKKNDFSKLGFIHFLVGDLVLADFFDLKFTISRFFLNSNNHEFSQTLAFAAHVFLVYAKNGI